MNDDQAGNSDLVEALDEILEGMIAAEPYRNQWLERIVVVPRLFDTLITLLMSARTEEEREEIRAVKRERPRLAIKAFRSFFSDEEIEGILMKGLGSLSDERFFDLWNSVETIIRLQCFLFFNRSDYWDAMSLECAKR